MTMRYAEGAVNGEFRGEAVKTYGRACHLVVETTAGVVVDQDVNDFQLGSSMVRYWIWDRGDKGNQDVHEVSFGSEALRLEITPCRDRLKRTEEVTV